MYKKKKKKKKQKAKCKNIKTYSIPGAALIARKLETLCSRTR